MLLVERYVLSDLTVIGGTTASGMEGLPET